jgi:hypothetical protein
MTQDVVELVSELRATIETVQNMLLGEYYYQHPNIQECEAAISKADAFLASTPEAKPELSEDEQVSIIQEHLDDLIGGGVNWYKEAKAIYDDLLAAQKASKA